MRSSISFCAAASLLGWVTVLAGCGSGVRSAQPSIAITKSPRSSPGGPELVDEIEGKVTGAAPGQKVVLYSRNGQSWWVQPLRSHLFTAVESDSTWKNSTHFGSEYAALLVEPGYRPQAKMPELPELGGGVLAKVSVKGFVAPPVATKVIHFSGYDWVVRAAPNSRGGEMNQYDPANAWVDEMGFLHLHMGDAGGHWSDAEVRLKRSLGYGTYRFVVEDTSHLAPSAVVGMFTLDERPDPDSRSELDIELSHWSKPGPTNADYVVQPYYVPDNSAAFTLPAGRFTHELRWEPGLAAFKTFFGTMTGAGARLLNTHVFTSGVPIPATETVHINFYDFYHSQSGLQRPAEVVIEKFEYLP